MNLLDILLGTPYWVWIVLAYLLFTGVKATKSRKVALWQLSIMPLIFITWSIYGIYNKCENCFTVFSFWLISLIFGILIGYRILRRLRFSIDSETKLIHLPGSFIPLSLSLMFFVTKYILGVTYALNPLMKANVLVFSFDLTLSGLISGISSARFITILYTYYKLNNKKL